LNASSNYYFIIQTVSPKGSTKESFKDHFCKDKFSNRKEIASDLFVRIFNFIYFFSKKSNYFELFNIFRMII